MCVCRHGGGGERERAFEMLQKGVCARVGGERMRERTG